VPWEAEGEGKGRIIDRAAWEQFQTQSQARPASSFFEGVHKGLESGVCLNELILTSIRSYF
jgi:hypothetical protein